MTEQERDRMARAIYDTRYAGYFVKAWVSLYDCEKEPWLRAADRAFAHARMILGVRVRAEKAA